MFKSQVSPQGNHLTSSVRTLWTWKRFLASMHHIVSSKILLVIERLATDGASVARIETPNLTADGELFEWHEARGKGSVAGKMAGCP